MSGLNRNQRAKRSLHAIAILLSTVLTGCNGLPVFGTIQSNFRGDAQIAAQVNASVQGPIEVKLPTVNDPGPMVAVSVRPGKSGAASPRVGVVDVDGLILNQNLTGLYSVGENPVAAFREKLETAANDPRVAAVVVRINSPGGSVTACDILAEELGQFRQSTGKPVVCCLMDLATSGAYYLAVGGDRIVAHPTTITGNIGALLNQYNLQDAMAQLNVKSEPIKSGALVDIGSLSSPLSEGAEALLREMVDSFRDRFRERVTERRPSMTAVDWSTLGDGRVVSAIKARSLHMIDRIGYVHDALDEAERLARISGSEVVLFQRKGYPTHSLYAITPNSPIDGQMIPLSYPGLDRAKVPTFLYLWQPDPTLLRLGGR
jgi:protease-4